METGLDKVKKFLLDGDIVKISIQFTGRQMAHTEFGPKLLTRIMAEINDIAELDREPRFEGRRFVTMVKPKKGIQKQHVQKKEGDKDETQN